MHFGCDDVGSFDEQRRVDVVVQQGVLLGTRHIVERFGRGADGARREVVPGDLGPVEEDADAVVAFEGEFQPGNLRDVARVENPPEPGGDVLVVGIGTEANLGRLGIAVPQLGRTSQPRAVIESRIDPGRAGSDARIEVVPCITKWNQQVFAHAVVPEPGRELHGRSGVRRCDVR